MGRRYRDAEFLRTQHVESGKSSTEIAQPCGTSPSTIRRRLARHDIEDGESLTTGECATCGDSFRYYPSVRDGQFCSNDCAGKPRRR
ncbi:hypothetical protein [Halorientalis pallida]|uniref:Homeodomain-like domain-containing protein n=1 Tax=Halorientalis pallida TaxID=2479928 RepID=A0A498L8Z7_9EURY|nr:hypothetical protein [Halorientalis pallida]RXK51613.1 hypothetical protein EAF64_03000 [Halorientalis pallida]